MDKQQLETNVVKPNLTFFDGENEHRLISHFDETTLDSKIKAIEDFMNNNEGKGKSDLEKDNLYGEAIGMWNSYAESLRNVRYTFYLNRKQYQFLTDLLIKNLEYDVNTVFLAIELTNMLGGWENEGAAKDEKTVKGYTSDATEVTYTYHLIAKHKVKGLTNASYRFAEVLRKIGDISKIIAYYDTHAKNLSKEIQEWVAAFEDGVIVEKPIKKKSTKKLESKTETEPQVESQN